MMGNGLVLIPLTLLLIYAGIFNNLTLCSSELVVMLSGHTSLQLTFTLSEKIRVCLAKEDKQDSRGRPRTWAVGLCVGAAAANSESSYLIFTEGVLHLSGGASLFLGQPSWLFHGPEMLIPFKPPLSIKTVLMVSVWGNTVSKIYGGVRPDYCFS